MTMWNTAVEEAAMQSGIVDDLINSVHGLCVFFFSETIAHNNLIQYFTVRLDTNIVFLLLFIDNFISH